MAKLHNAKVWHNASVNNVVDLNREFKRIHQKKNASVQLQDNPFSVVTRRKKFTNLKYIYRFVTMSCLCLELVAVRLNFSVL